MRNAHCALVSDRIFAQTDVFAEDATALNSAEQDPMGVLFAAVTLARYVLTEEVLQRSAAAVAGVGLDENVRVVLAGVLFFCYKIRSEAFFGCRDMRVRVLSYFLTPAELRCYLHESALLAIDTVEAQILSLVPILEVIDRNPFTGFEFAVYEQHTEGAITRSEMWLVLGVGYFYFHAAACATKTSLLEELGLDLDAEDIGRAIALVGLSSVDIVRGDAPRVSNCYGAAAARAAARLVINACELESSPSLRVGAYDCSSHPVCAMVAPSALRSLSRVYERVLF